MGKCYWFECGKCGYRAKVAGKADEGLHVAVQTILCPECKELYDAVIQIRVMKDSQPVLHGLLRTPACDPAKRAPSFLWALNRLRYTGEKFSEWLKFPPQCPVAPTHKVRVWNDPDRCPRCGAHLEKAALAYRVWD